MKHWLWAIAAGLALAAGCTPTDVWIPEKDQLTYRVQSAKDAIYEYEPLNLTLVAVNNTAAPKRFDLPEHGGALLLHHIKDNDEVFWRTIPVEPDVVGQQVMPGESVDVPLGDLSGRARLEGPGTWVVLYRYSRRMGPGKTAGATTRELFLQCVPQPLNLPAGTPPEVAGAMRELAAGPPHQYVSMYPAWTTANPTDAMGKLVRMGDPAAPALLANLNHYRIRPAVIQLLGDLKHKPAVPALLSLLQMDDSTQDRLILSSLATLTRIPKGFDLYSNWSTAEGKEAALAAYRAWYERNR